MSEICQNAFLCPGGNCSGCKNGKIWCDDPSCAPFCSECFIVQGHDFISNWVFVLIISALIFLLFVIWVGYGPNMFLLHSNEEENS